MASSLGLLVALNDDLGGIFSGIFSRNSPRFTADQIKPFFESQGINIKTIGFPNMNSRDGYFRDFDKIRAILKRSDDGGCEVIIKGRYHTGARASYQDSSGNWHPGQILRYKFKIENGELNLGRGKR